MIPSRQCKCAHLPVRWQALLALWFCSVASPALAVTLGQENILSLLGDPIEVEIDVLQWDDIDLERVQIALASPAEYESFDLTWLPVLEELSFNLIGPDGSGEVKVLVSTRDPVAEPYVELLLVMRWPGGSLLREYVLLFDLPQSPARMAPATVVTVPAEPASVEAIAAPPLVQIVDATTADSAALPDLALEPLQEPEPEPVVQNLAPEPDPDMPEPRNQGAIVVEAAAPAVQPPATGRRVYQVREGDGLWSIAQQFQPAGVGENIYQMLVSLHDLNRAAFINGNISLLKANALLQIPDADDITAIDAAGAESRFEQRWAEGTTRLQTALRGDPLPAFSDLYQGENVEEGPQAELENRQPGEETGRAAPGGTGLLLPAATPVVVPVSESEATPGGGDLLVGEQSLQATSSQLPVVAGAATAAVQDLSSTSATVNPYLDTVLASTRELQVLLQNRSLQIAGLEEQLAEMRQRMRDAQQVTARLNEALEQALAMRSGQSASTAGGVTLLSVVALVLLVALLVAMVMLLKLTAQLRSQRQLWSEDRAVLDELAEMTVSSENRSYPAAPTVPGKRSRDTGIVVEEYVMSAAEEDEGLQQELMELIGPAVRDEPGRQDHDRNGA
jgi:FimV-like protein